MDNELLLSICIPTNGIVEWMIPVIESIYAQGVDNDLFEVVITDNGGKDDLEKALQAYDYPNLHYYITTSHGFTNQVDAFEKCSGLFCKMLNHRSKMLLGSIEKLIALVERYKEDKPIIYCAEGNAKGGALIECENTDEFVRAMSVWGSWSAGTSAWKTDLNNLRQKVANSTFPHTLFLFQLREESKYVIWNEKYEIMGSDAGKGGYDLFRAFSVTYLDILTDLRIKGRVSVKTFVEVKEDMFKFIRTLYLNEELLPTKHTFIVKNVAESMDVYYGRYYYRKMVIWGYIRRPLVYVKKALTRIQKFRKYSSA